MKDKILFWIDAGLMHFGVAKTLQEQIDADLFVVYDLNNHLKKSFKNEGIENAFNQELKKFLREKISQVN